MLSTLDLGIGIFVALCGAVAFLWGMGKAYATLLFEIRDGNRIAAESVAKVDGLGHSIDRFKSETRGEIRFLRETDAELGTRVALTEQLLGLPAPWKRTQPIKPVPQDIFPEGDTE